jgi:tetraprenyl-beta-curcumene synthase
LSTATHTDERRIATAAPGARASAGARRLRERLALAHVFAVTVSRYLLAILPQVTRERARWRTLAAAIPDERLRATAVESLRKRGNIEGAALFATLAPAAQRHTTVRALVAFQTAYNYLDALSELPSEDPNANGRQLHQALIAALHPGAPHPDYYSHSPHRGDERYLIALVDACRRALAGLPSYPAVAPTARAAAARIVDFQAMNLSEAQGGQGALARWASDAAAAASGLEWWETAGAAGSSLAVHALIAAAAQARLDSWQAREIDRAYYPWIGALHSLLDSLVDRTEDEFKGQRSLLEHYRSPADAASSLEGIATRAAAAARRLPRPHAHRAIVTAMCSYYLSAPECDTVEAQAIARALARPLGQPLTLAVAMFRCRRRFHALTRRTYT